MSNPNNNLQAFLDAKDAIVNKARNASATAGIIDDGQALEAGLVRRKKYLKYVN
jgi:hypothetical protein